MEAMEVSAKKTMGKILCCECGLSIDPNPSNMCVACIRSRVDISEGIMKTGQLQLCKFCNRYFHPPNSWTYADLESKELLAVCLKKMKGSLDKVRLVDAGFIWTEPHSKRVKVKVTIQKEIPGGAILEQSFPVEFTQVSFMCDDCRRLENKDYWRACVQVRQKADHKKTLFYLEQLILKHKAQIKCNGIKPVPGGLDFYYSKQQDARRLTDFLMAVLPCRYHTAKELVTQDDKNNTYDYKYTFAVEVVPICKDNVVCLTKSFAQSLGNMGQVCLCIRVAEKITLIDTNNGQIADVSSTQYFREPFLSLGGPKQMVEYTVIDIEPMTDLNRGSGHGTVSKKHKLAEAWIMKSSELGRNDAEQVSVRTHLGHLLNPGDSVMGLDLKNCNTNNETLDKMKQENIPDAILVKKVYDRSRRIRKRKWKLQRFEGDRMETASMEGDYNDFLDDLEEDPHVRQNISIYRKRDDPTRMSESTVGGEEDFPQISLQEMLEEMVIEDEEMQDTTVS